MTTSKARVDFDAPAVLRKWPSLDNERRTGTAPYLLIDGTLDGVHRFFHGQTSLAAPPVRNSYFAAASISDRDCEGRAGY